MSGEEFDFLADPKRRVTRVKFCRSGQSTNASVRAVDVASKDAEEDPIKETHGVWAKEINAAHESSEDNLSMIMDSGAEEHVVTRAVWQRFGAATCSGAAAKSNR